ncbi:MAG: XRE family transcriptional regulator [Bacteroidetes bacterium CG02_land_8_20_14_3_00_31_25]|nr:MAG: transcriptional regulator [Bacteroidetes bacterium CG23_combo_of_CG06-09_8_20_14_all_32_9]PIV58178.1 MAG: XRE family transcriptional regulator [Bacteroidetes bacterium CG02_land_8_20_14_3_00_31_25]PIX32854.1 MAG: XRE family transcriptional regulator [Bacteroidetes bacterium CG_4_8_14_3_um_filter_31_14]PIY02868.1 MAG: XRE family transcriptional regulator [Bacteroidetes bacterium CG_4_10_14_3_um_filter_31_20]
MESFGDYIRRLRVEKGLNQTELAAKIGLDSGGLSKVENGKKELKENKLLLLAKALKIDVADIKKQYLSEKFAEDCFKYKCPEAVFQLAEEKAKYYKSVNIKQSKLKF